MSNQASYALILSFFLFNGLNAQTGEGCGALTTCLIPGQVRMNAKYGPNNYFLGGCSCCCDVAHYNPNSIGDCACWIAVNPPAPIPPPPTPIIPQTPITSKQPVTPYQSPVVITQEHETCLTEFDCACPVGTIGPCTIVCAGIDSCKDGIVACNNDGYDCVVDCIGEQACIGETNIIGPAAGTLTVNCIGQKSCEGDLVISGETSTDVTVNCDGLTSCLKAQINFGTRKGEIHCNGLPDSCQQAIFNLLPGAADRAGSAFACKGGNCPSHSPPAYSNIFGPQVVDCIVSGNCAGCDVGTSGVCTINCNGMTDSCMTGVISCNNDGFDCIVNCLTENACVGAYIVGPVGGTLTVNCLGDVACEGETTFVGSYGTDMSIMCEGPEACKGNAEYYFGTGVGRVECNGMPDSCLGGNVFHVQTVPGASFSCVGANCPM